MNKVFDYILIGIFIVLVYIAYISYETRNEIVALSEKIVTTNDIDMYQKTWGWTTTTNNQ